MVALVAHAPAAIGIIPHKRLALHTWSTLRPQIGDSSTHPAVIPEKQLSRTLDPVPVDCMIRTRKQGILKSGD
jgi:hypothetical protein